MLFLNISSDCVFLQIADEQIKLSRNSLETYIWPKLVELYQKYRFTKVFLLNWPGGFTNLRVGTLAINLLNTLEKNKIEIYSISKIDLFQYLYDEWFLESKWVIYIGQKKNVWLYDFQKWKHDTIKKDDINYDENIFFDLVFEENYFLANTIDFSLLQQGIKINNWKKSIEIMIDELNIKPEKTILPNYFIQPTMWWQ